MVGEIELPTGERRLATVTALTDVSVLQISKKALDRLFAKTPEAARELFRQPGDPPGDVRSDRAGRVRVALRVRMAGDASRRCFRAATAVSRAEP